MKQYLKDKKVLLMIILLFAVVFSTSFLAYLVTPFSNNNSKLLYIDIGFLIPLFIGTILLEIFLLKRIKKSTDLLIFNTEIIMISAIIMTIIFKIISSIDPNLYVVKTGLKSVAILLIYFPVVLLISFLPIKEKHESKTLSKKDI